ncbi:MAG TPA: acetyl-CoA carboxylase biotin carboxyl carrier protein [Candidatus Binataceae bacterium]|nr:acetyl-CoA carboxylase biotin carboxyl carrier protein [Candidatus Binataceae bacterium]
MEVREIKALVTLMNEHGLVELEIEDKKGKVRLVRGSLARAIETNSEPHPAPAPAPKAAKAKPAAPRGGSKPAEAPLELAANQRLVESPMVGTFYRSPSPDAAAFVEEGTSVRKGQAVCIIEAMKMMNEIEAPAAGRIVRIIVENAQPVEYGQALMIIEVG